MLFLAVVWSLIKLVAFVWAVILGLHVVGWILGALLWLLRLGR